jgi:formylglycine-generating enzyme required for sulfatase activity
MTSSRKLKVFLCHASQDKPAVRKLYASLSAEPWIELWLDEECLLPGMDWDLEIQKALRDADLILVCLSRESVAKEGYVQREFKRALSYAEEKPEGTIYIIPLRLDDCTPPTKFRQWQWVDYFAENSGNRLLQALRLRAQKLGLDSLAAPRTESSPTSTVVSSKSHPQPSSFTPGGRPVYIFGGMDFVKVTSGDFYMGADDIEIARPQHLIYQLRHDFYLGRFPVTNQEYSHYLRDTGQPITTAKDKAKHPVVNISWNEAQEYIAWFNGKHGTELPAEHKFRLPSEAEWEKCARGVDGNKYPWGNKFDMRRCNSAEGKVGETTAVGIYSPQGDSAYGAADMAGNVWEWTRSLGIGFSYPYSFEDRRENENANEAFARVLRGGSYNDDHLKVRAAFRDSNLPFIRDYNYGLRVAICPPRDKREL